MMLRVGALGATGNSGLESGFESGLKSRDNSGARRGLKLSTSVFGSKTVLKVECSASKS